MPYSQERRVNMNEIANFTLGLIVGIGSMLLIIVLWGLMNISGQISREEEGQSYSVTRSREKMKKAQETPDDDLLKLDMGEPLNRPDDGLTRGSNIPPRPDPPNPSKI